MNTFHLKMLALILMVIDHIGYYFEGAPEILRLIGRLSFPLFLFCMTQGYYYTHSRFKYLLRLYGMSIVMGCIMYVCGDGYGYHNIFITMFWVGIFISAIELFTKSIKKGCIFYGIIALSEVFYLLLQQYIPSLRHLSGDILYSFLPSFLHTEYDLLYIFLGVAMYFLRDKKDMFCATYILIALVEFCTFSGQFLIIFSLPFMLSYNHEKGRGMKWFFYIFYPAHTLILFYLSAYLLS